MKNLLHTSQSRYVGCLVPLSTVVPSAGSSSLLCPVVTWSLADGTIEPRKGHPTFLEYGWMAKVLQERASQRWEWQGVFNLLHTGLFFFFTRDSDPPTLCPEIRKKKKNTLTPSCQPDTYMWQDRDVLYHHTATWMLSTLARSTLSSVRSVLDILLHHQWPQWKSLFCCFVIFR